MTLSGKRSNYSRQYLSCQHSQVCFEDRPALFNYKINQNLRDDADLSWPSLDSVYHSSPFMNMYDP